MVSHSKPLFSLTAVPFFETRQPQQIGPKKDGLLCCVCHEHNTTFKYEVVYKTASSLSTLTLRPQATPIAIQHVNNNQKQIAQITKLTNEDTNTPYSCIKHTSDIFSSYNCQTISSVERVSLFFNDHSHDYYNFPPRHPRHGHLKWPVWTPIPSPIPNVSLAQSVCVDTYPDYPIHIPTVTLKRLSSARKGKR